MGVNDADHATHDETPVVDTTQGTVAPSGAADGAARRIGEVARIAGVSVRTLHHYDAVGLLSPTGRSAAGYRLYTQADLERLQQILFFR
ncbi:MAG TPA: MerR family transcriptional regulator, partial [Thermoleophilia bacterium]|nr:MerR family transcriptional regulator [Thermoleophilia bacterium]